ncbi:MAG: hypothetical protein K1X92_01545 [Bacteroidia bacterium]|nr:hypothetical protein [Bacteroidia bacterium]
MDITLQKMEYLIALWKFRNDKRHIFLSCYQRMTQSMIKSIENGEFEDPEWVIVLLNHFAEYYFRALTLYEAGETHTPLVWKAVHETALKENPGVLQLLATGINAHINYDLVFVLVDLLAKEWSKMSDTQKSIRYKDYIHVNQVIAATIDQVQDEVVEINVPVWGVMDTLMGRLDEKLASLLINRWRSEVWDDALSIISTQSEAEKARLHSGIQQKVLQRTHYILLKNF